MSQGAEPQCAVCNDEPLGTTDGPNDEILPRVCGACTAPPGEVWNTCPLHGHYVARPPGGDLRDCPKCSEASDYERERQRRVALERAVGRFMSEADSVIARHSALWPAYDELRLALHPADDETFTSDHHAPRRAT